MPSQNARFQAAESFLNSTINRGVKLGLENTIRLLDAIGNPHQGLRLVHVAGTNGKGSVCALLEAASLGAGMSCGLSSSPHLVSVRERVRIDGVPLAEDEFAGYVEFIQKRAGHLFESRGQGCPTYFEMVTAISCLAFASRKVDVGILEVGLGGRLDSTNVVTPAVSVITTIDLDHTQFLGSTLADIAGEKAGIIKPGVPVVVGETKAEAVDRMVAIAAERKAPVHLFRRDFDAHQYEIRVSDGAWSQHCEVSWRRVRESVDVPLIGAHQLHNVAVAVAVLHVLRENGWKLDLPSALAGLGDAHWAARLQRLPDGLIVDAAHNPAGMAVSVSALREALPGTRFNVLCAFLADKQWQRSIDLLAPNAASLRIAPIDNPRSESPWAIKRYVQQRWPDLLVKVCRTPESGLRQIQRLPDPLVIGSIYFAGDVLAHYYPDGVVV